MFSHSSLLVRAWNATHRWVANMVASTVAEHPPLRLMALKLACQVSTDAYTTRRLCSCPCLRRLRLRVRRRPLLSSASDRQQVIEFRPKLRQTSSCKKNPREACCCLLRLAQTANVAASRGPEPDAVRSAPTSTAPEGPLDLRYYARGLGTSCGTGPIPALHRTLLPRRLPRQIAWLLSLIHI